MEKLDKVFTGDVLILGGSMAGLITAIRAKELNSAVDVMVVDKATTGFSGAKVNKGAGMLWACTEEDNIDKFCDYYTKDIGHGLEDQQLLKKVSLGSRELVDHLDRWELNPRRDDNGKMIKFAEYPYWSFYAVDADILIRLRKIALGLGVRIIDKTQAVELLTDNGRITGVVGFGLLDGAFCIFKAKSVVIATGSCNWMVTNMWFSGRGDGIAAAYRSGAEMRNAEFSNMHDIGLRGNMSSLMGGQYCIYNDDNEYLAPKYTKPFEPDVDIGIFLGMEKEVAEGKGPIGFEETEFLIQNPLAANGLLFKWDRPEIIRFWKRLFEKEGRYMADHSWRPEAIPAFLGECACIKVDHELKTTLPGLWALGDASRAGSGFSGAVPHPCRLRGSGLMWAGVSALFSAPSLVAYTLEAGQRGTCSDYIRELKKTIYAPMQREKGISPRDAIWRLKEVISPPRYAIRKNKTRIQEALDRVTAIQHQAETEVTAADDWHVLGLCHDLRNMAQCAEIYYKTALAREETRGWHYRDDFPRQDDTCWRKWIIVRKINGHMVVSTEEMPLGT
jgi:succinate dehydrogenase/fumarate reductase flavoprotein subunit